MNKAYTSNRSCCFYKHYDCTRIYHQSQDVDHTELETMNFTNKKFYFKILKTVFQDFKSVSWHKNNARQSFNLNPQLPTLLQLSSTEFYKIRSTNTSVKFSFL